MTHIVICDDEPLHLQHTHDLTTAYTAGKPVTIETVDAAATLLEKVDAGYCPDIAILDVELGGDSGIDLAKTLNQRCPSCQIIFLTAFSRYASQAYFADHTWFVVKSEIDTYLPLALERAFHVLEAGKEPEASILVRQRRAMQKVPVSQILYLERCTYRTRIVTTEDALFSTQAPAELLKDLPENRFIRCHQSFWVNRDKILSLARNDFHLIDGTVIPISRTYKKSAADLFCSTIKNRFV